MYYDWLKIILFHESNGYASFSRMDFNDYRYEL